MPLAAGQVLNNRYRIVKLLGQGGFGAVYRAWDLNFSLAVAVKENSETSPEGQRQFLREAQMLRTLRHPNLPVVTDVFSVAGQGQYLVMDYVEGDDLQEMLDRNPGKPLPEAQALGWIAEICDALIYLHSQNPPVIHRDIKPANIKITPQGKAMQVDFGIAKVFDAQFTTTRGARAYTAGYSPPEQYGQGRTDAQSDVYALGATAYTLLTGVVPPESTEVVSGNLPPPAPAHTLNPHLPPSISAALAEALQPSRAQRTRSVAAFKAALSAGVAASTVQAQPWRSPAASQAPTQTAAPAPAPSPLRRWGWALVLAGIALLAFVFWIGTRMAGGTEDIPTPLPTRAPVVAVTLPVGTPATIPSDSPILTATSTLVLSTPVEVTDTPNVTPTGIPDRITDDFGFQMALVPAGAFQMGSEQGDSDEKPVHTVELDDYYMDVTEVTNASFAAFLNARGNQTEGGVTWLDAKDADARIHQSGETWQADVGSDRHPVVEVSWYGAKAYCEWRGARLPSEAEWEKAARGGLEGKLYPWGDEEPTCYAGASNGARYEDCGRGTAPVGSYGANGYGLFDTAGNVWEWVNSLYQPYPYDSGDGREELSASDGRGVRGGSWNNTANNLRVADRYGNGPMKTDIFIGFRCARSP